MAKLSKRVLSVILSLTMMLTLLPTTAFASGRVTIDCDTRDGATVSVTGDLPEDATVSADAVSVDVEGIKTKVSEWETKYNEDTQALKDQLDAANYGFAVKGAVAGLKFTSESAKKAFVMDLTAKKLPLQDGRLLGMDDFVKAYQTSDPSAFLPESDDKTPVVTRGGAGGGPAMGADAAMRAAFGLPDNSKNSKKE